MHVWNNTRGTVCRQWKHGRLLLKLTLLNTILLGRQMTIQRVRVRNSNGAHVWQPVDRSVRAGRPSEGAELWSNIYRHGGNKLLHHSQRVGWGKTRKGAAHVASALGVGGAVRAVSKLGESIAHPPTITVHQSHMSALFVPWFNF